MPNRLSRLFVYGFSTSARLLKRVFLFLNFPRRNQMIKKIFLLTLFASLMIAKNATAAECLAGECPENHTSCKCNEQGKLIEAVYVSEYYTALKTYDGAGHNTSTLDYRNAEDFASNTPFRNSPRLAAKSGFFWRRISSPVSSSIP